MKEEINLLPPAVKSERWRRLIGRRLSRLYWWLMLVTAAVALALGVADGVLGQINQRLQMMARPPAENSVSAVVRSVNQLVLAMQQRVAGHQPWGLFIVVVLKQVPPEVTIRQLQVKAGTEQLVLEGTTTNRGAVATLEQRLRSLEAVEKVEAPLQNLALGREGVFSFTLQRKREQP